RLHEALGDRAADRRAHRRVAEFLAREVVCGAPILKARLERVNVVEGGLIIRVGYLQPRFGGVAIDLRQEPSSAELLRPSERRARIVAVRGRLADRGDLIVGRRLAILRAVDAEL